MVTGAREGGGVVLVLSRKINQSIMIGDQIEVMVLSVVGEKVRLGIRAPREVPVFRDELYAELSGLDRPTPATQPAVPSP